MKKILSMLGAGALVGTLLVAPASSAEAQTSAFARAGKTRCAKGSGSYSGTCWTLLKSAKKLVVVEAIPLENKTRRKKANMHCSFSRTVTKSVEVGGSVSSSVEANVFAVVKANVSATVHRNVSQTASQASTAGGDITLRPGESVVCQRTYGYVVSRVKQYTYYGGKSKTKILKAKIPASLGVRIVD